MNQSESTLSELLEQARGIASRLSGTRALANEFDSTGGMASIQLTWDPYDSGWQALANWSNSFTVVSGEPVVDPSEAVSILISKLQEIINHNSQK